MVFTLVSRYSMKNARPMPTTSPMITPSAMFNILLGFTGYRPGIARSTISTMEVLGNPRSVCSKKIFAVSDCRNRCKSSSRRFASK